MFLKAECAVVGTPIFFLNFVSFFFVATLPPLGAPSLAYTTKGGGYSEPPEDVRKNPSFSPLHGCICLCLRRCCFWPPSRP